MQLFILNALISLLVAAPYDGTGDFKAHGSIAGNQIDVPIHVPSNSCNNNSKAIGDAKNSFDNSCENTSVEFDTDAHTKNGNGLKPDSDTHAENVNVLKSNADNHTENGNNWRPNDS